MAMITIKDLCKKYADLTVYDNFNLTIEEGKTLVVLGESGSGKTTLINVLLSLTDFSGKVDGVELPIATVFQQDRLVPNLTVEQNVKLVNPDIDVINALKEVGLEGIKDSYIKTLSGGMARRVALLRALYFPSKIMFLDEPFINLDLAHKFAVMDIIKNRQKKNPQTIVAVTHDVKEAVYLADRIIVLKKGKIIYDNTDVKEQTEKELFDLLINSKKF